MYRGLVARSPRSNVVFSPVAAMSSLALLILGSRYRVFTKKNYFLIIFHLSLACTGLLLFIKWPRPANRATLQCQCVEVWGEMQTKVAGDWTCRSALTLSTSLFLCATYLSIYQTAYTSSLLYPFTPSIKQQVILRDKTSGELSELLGLNEYTFNPHQLYKQVLGEY